MVRWVAHFKTSVAAKYVGAVLSIQHEAKESRSLPYCRVGPSICWERSLQGHKSNNDASVTRHVM
jgi:hypothetical protein